MRMPDGGFRPAYNAQAVSDVESRLALAGRVTDEGADAAQLLPMVQWVARVLGLRPDAWLVDGAYRNLKAFSALESQGIRVFSPLPARKNLLLPEGRRGADEANPAMRGVRGCRHPQASAPTPSAHRRRSCSMRRSRSARDCAGFTYEVASEPKPRGCSHSSPTTSCSP